MGSTNLIYLLLVIASVMLTATTNRVNNAGASGCMYAVKLAVIVFKIKSTGSGRDFIKFMIVPIIGMLMSIFAYDSSMGTLDALAANK